MSSMYCFPIFQFYIRDRELDKLGGATTGFWLKILRYVRIINLCLGMDMLFEFECNDIFQL
jgi:hypothetical protein